MKKLLFGLSAIVLALTVLAGGAQAREGRIEISGDEVACEGVSLWKERNYRVTGRCDGLVYPYETRLEHYVLWAKTDERGEIVRVSEIENGYFDGNVSDAFASLYVTAESDGLPRRPSATQIASGTVSLFSFVKGEEGPAIATPAPLAEEAGTGTTVQSAVGNATSGSQVGEVIGKIVRSLLVIIGVVIVLVIGTSLVFRRRGSVST